MSGGFPDLGLLPELVRATQSMGWLLPSDVQDEAIPLVLGGGDVMVAARTGSGKTGAFGLPAVQLAYEIREQQLAVAEAKGAAGSASSSGAAAAAGSSSAPAPAPAPAPATEAALPAVKLSAEDRSAWVAVHPSGMIAQSRNPRAWGGVRSNVGVMEGKAYFEFKLNDSGIGRVGVGTVAASYELGTCPSGWGFGGTGMKSNSRRFEAHGEAFTKGDVIGVRVCVTGKTGAEAGWVAFSKNGTEFDKAYTLPKGARPLFPMVCLKNADASVNFGSRPFLHPPADAAFSGLMRPRAAGAARSSRPAPGGPQLLLAEAGGGAAALAAAPKAAADKAPVVLVLEPTRDLAEQTYKVLRDFAGEIPGAKVRCVLLCGGVDTGRAAAAIARGVEVVVGTPGRVLDFARAASGAKKSKGRGGGAGSLDLSRVRLLVLDEADKLVGDAEDRDRLAAIWGLLPKDAAAATAAAAGGGAAEPAGALQVCFFSATLHSPQIAELAGRVCHNPTWVDLKGKDSVPDTVHHAVLEVDPARDLTWAGATPAVAAAAKLTDAVHSRDRGRALTALPSPGADGRVELSAAEASQAVKVLKLLALPDLLDAMGREQCMIFCRTNMDCESVCAYLTALGGGKRFSGSSVSGVENPYSAVMVGGALRPQERQANLEAFKEGEVRCLVCTDAVARGIDVAGLPFMINFCLPDDAEQYVHRSGRVGRADKLGLAVSIVAAPRARERVWFLQKSAGRLSRANLPMNTKDFDAGGNCVWMDEAALLRAIEARLHKGGATSLVPAAGTETAAAASSSSSSSSTAGAEPRATIPRIRSVATVTPTGRRKDVAAVGAELAALPGRTALLAPGGAAGGSPALVAPTGRQLLYAMRFPEGVGGDGTVYGESQAEESGSAEGAARLLALQPTVQTLAALERQAQSSYLMLRAKFGASVTAGAASAAAV